MSTTVLPSGDTTGETDTANIKAATAQTAGTDPGKTPGGGDYCLTSDAEYYINATVELPDGVRSYGVGANSGPWPNGSGNNLGTRVIAAAGFPPTCPMFTLGSRLPAVATTGAEFGAQLAGMTIDGAGAAMVGVYTNKAQEHSRLDFLTVQGCTMIGVHVATPNGSPGANQTSNFGAGNLKVQPPRANPYLVTALNGAITVTTGTNPFDAASNYCNPVTTTGQQTGVVLIASTAGFPAQGCIIVTQNNQQAPLVVYYTANPTSGILTGCITDATPSQSPALSVAANAQVETPACGMYVQNVGAMRAVEDSTFDSGAPNATCVGLRLDGCNGTYTRLHCEHVKYGVLMNSAAMCMGAKVDQVMLGGDYTVQDLIRVGKAGAANSHNSFTLAHIMSYVNGPNTINDLANGFVSTEEIVSFYSPGDSNSGLAGAPRPILTSSSRIPPRFSKGLVIPTKNGPFTDADFPYPQDGLIGVNTAAASLMFRSGGKWYTA